MHLSTFILDAVLYVSAFAGGWQFATLFKLRKEQRARSEHKLPCGIVSYAGDYPPSCGDPNRDHTAGCLHEAERYIEALEAHADLATSCAEEYAYVVEQKDARIEELEAELTIRRRNGDDVDVLFPGGFDEMMTIRDCLNAADERIKQLEASHVDKLKDIARLIDVLGSIRGLELADGRPVEMAIWDANASYQESAVAPIQLSPSPLPLPVAYGAALSAGQPGVGAGFLGGASPVATRQAPSQPMPPADAPWCDLPAGYIYAVHYDSRNKNGKLVPAPAKTPEERLVAVYRELLELSRLEIVEGLAVDWLAHNAADVLAPAVAPLLCRRS